MKFFVFTKQRILVMAGALAVCLIGAGILTSSYSQVVTASAGERKIPVYCVEKDEKVVSISFDAAWGNEQTDTLLNILDEKKQLSDEKMKSEVEQCNSKIEKLTGKKPTLFRPPYGDYNNSVVSCVNEADMYCIQWDIDSLDWKDPTAAQMVERIKNNLKNGSIILMHNGAKNTPEALPQIIDTIKAEGYEIVPISELLLKGEYYTDHEGRMHLKTEKETV